MTEKIGFGAHYDYRCGLSPGEFARRLEDLGFDGFLVGERPTMRGYSNHCFASMCLAAGATSRITVASDVLLMPLHHPVWVAQEFGSLDVLSGGRVILGLGVGGDGGGQGVKQFEAFGIPLPERGARTDEGIEIVKSLWTDAESSHHGRFFNFDGITMDPKPAQKPHPPIWVGGRPGGTEIGPDGKPRKKSATGAIRRAARFGDGWNPYYMTTEMYRDSVVQIKEHAAALGRDISHMAWSLNIAFLMADSYDEALDAAKKKLRYGTDLAERVARYDILGSPADVIKRLEAYIDAGCRYFDCNWSCEPGQIVQHLELISKEVIPHFRGS